MPQTIFAIFEAVNSTRREILIGGTIELLSTLQRRHAEKRPVPIEHWRSGDEVEYRFVAYSVARRDIKRLIGLRAESQERPEWRVLTSLDSI